MPVVSTTLLQVGPFKFELSTAAYQTMQRTNEWRWAELNRVSKRPAQQSIGRGKEVIKLKGVVYTGFDPSAGIAGVNGTVGDGQIESLRQIADLQIPLTVVGGGGSVFGLYTMKRVSETASVLFSDGTPRKQEFDIDLQRYDDGALGVVGAIVGGAFGDKRSSPGGTAKFTQIASLVGSLL